jgi:hypothetical protein
VKVVALGPRLYCSAGVEPCVRLRSAAGCGRRCRDTPRTSAPVDNLGHVDLVARVGGGRQAACARSQTSLARPEVWPIFWNQSSIKRRPPDLMFAALVVTLRHLHEHGSPNLGCTRPEVVAPPSRPVERPVRHDNADIAGSLINTRRQARSGSRRPLREAQQRLDD